MSAPLRGAIRLPDGTPVRGRSLRGPLPDGPLPDYGLYLVGRSRLPQATTRPPAWRPSRRRRGHRWEPGWEADWIVWPDFRTPADPRQAACAIVEAFRRAQAGGRVEVACDGGRGRTGTVLACMAVLAGVPAGEAVAWVRASYQARAVETQRQRAWVQWFALEDLPC
jgi:protein-tyrosine phosphatase